MNFEQLIVILLAIEAFLIFLLIPDIDRMIMNHIIEKEHQETLKKERAIKQRLSEA